MTRPAIIKLIEKKIDEIVPNDTDDITPDTGIIESVMDASAHNLIKKLPLWILQGYSPSAYTEHSIRDLGNIEIDPSEPHILRLKQLKLAGWAETVSEAITVAHPTYKLQKYKELRGGAAKPVVVLISPTKLEYYSDPSESHTIEEFAYVPKKPIEADDYSNIIQLITDQAAIDVLNIYERAQLASTRLEKLHQEISLL
jgi:hypothetical protein